MIKGGGHPLNRRIERERAERNQRERRGPAPKGLTAVREWMGCPGKVGLEGERGGQRGL